MCCKLKLVYIIYYKRACSNSPYIKSLLLLLSQALRTFINRRNITRHATLYYCNDIVARTAASFAIAHVKTTRIMKNATICCVYVVGM